MNKFVFAWGVIILLFALIMHSLLSELEFQTFREDIGPWKLVAIVIAMVGGITALGGTVLKRQPKILR